MAIKAQSTGNTDKHLDRQLLNQTRK